MLNAQSFEDWLNSISNCATGLRGWINAHKSGLSLLVALAVPWFAVAQGQIQWWHALGIDAGLLGIGTQTHSANVQMRRSVAQTQQRLQEAGWKPAQAVHTMTNDRETTGKPGVTQPTKGK